MEIAKLLAMLVRDSLTSSLTVHFIRDDQLSISRKSDKNTELKYSDKEP